MSTEKTLGESARRPAVGWSRTVNLINPLRAVWWLVTNVRFAIVLLALLVVISLAGVLIPQMPVNVRGDILLEQNWLEQQENNFGFMTDPMNEIGMFQIFQQSWFALLLSVTVVSTGAYVVSRFPGVWMTIKRPRKRVPDRYFDIAPHRTRGEGAVSVERLEETLRAHRYRVERVEEGESTLVFADRWQWAQLGSLLTHIAVIVFILSAVVSRVDAFSSPLFLSEGSTLPVFPVKDTNQMQVQLETAYAKFAVDGQPLDYRTDMVIYKNGEEALRCSSTVNTPCKFDGYRFYQVAHFGFGAELVVRDIATGNVLYRETLALTGKTPSPRVRVTSGSGEVLLDETVIMTDTIDTDEGAVQAGLVKLPDGRPLSLYLPQVSDDLLVFEPNSDPDAIRATLGAGETSVTGGLSVTYVGLESVPSAVVPEVPLPEAAGEGATGDVAILLTNVIYGTDRTSEGDGYSITTNGDPTLTLIGVDAASATLKAGESVESGGLEYTFEGQRNFAGIDVARDRSDTLVWVGALCIVIGLMITFWVPRRRLWAKISPRRAAGGELFGTLALAGQAPSHANYTRELRDLARQAGARIEDGTEDDD